MILDDFMIRTEGILTHRENSVIKKTKKQLDQYFSQKRKNFFISLDLHGTQFQKQVWNTLRTIGFGQTYSYEDVAKKMDNPKACRAIGMANHHNPIPILIPCHRVINKSGALGGFANNTSDCLQLKRNLLALEKEALELEQTGVPLMGNITGRFTELS